MGSAERERRMNGRTELVGIAKGLGFECSNAARHAQAVMELKGACIGSAAEAAAAMLWCGVPLQNNQTNQNSVFLMTVRENGIVFLLWLQEQTLGAHGAISSSNASLPRKAGYMQEYVV
jgi:hypothetical protein